MNSIIIEIVEILTTGEWEVRFAFYLGEEGITLPVVRITGYFAFYAALEYAKKLALKQDDLDEFPLIVWYDTNGRHTFKV